MSDETMVTEREAVRREREAVSRTVEHLFRVMRALGCPHIEEVDGRRIEDKWYPLPKVTQYRAIKDPLEWRILWSVRDGVIVGEALDSGHWYPLLPGHSAFLPVSSRVRVWADLLANPTEEVEDES